MVVASGSQNGSQSDLRITSRSRGVRRCRAERESVRGGLPDAGMIRAAGCHSGCRPVSQPVYPVCKPRSTPVRRSVVPPSGGACDTPANADERGQLRPKLRPAGAARLPSASQPAACNLAQFSSVAPGPASAGTGSSRLMVASAVSALGYCNLVRLGPSAYLTRFRVLRLMVQTHSVGSGPA